MRDHTHKCRNQVLLFLSELYKMSFGNWALIDHHKQFCVVWTCQARQKQQSKILASNSIHISLGSAHMACALSHQESSHGVYCFSWGQAEGMMVWCTALYQAWQAESKISKPEAQNRRTRGLAGTLEFKLLILQVKKRKFKEDKYNCSTRI